MFNRFEKNVVEKLSDNPSDKATPSTSQTLIASSPTEAVGVGCISAIVQETVEVVAV